MRILFAALTLFSCISCLAQNTDGSPSSAQGTFYTVGVFQSELTDSKHGAFEGHIFDGDSELALMEMGKFVTFSLP
jgi:hypothetical protein